MTATLFDATRSISLAFVAALTQATSFLLRRFWVPAVSLSGLSPLLELVTQSVSLLVILFTGAYHAYHYFVETEEDIRQEQIDRALRYIAKRQKAELEDSQSDSDNV